MQLRHLVSEFKNLLPVAWHIWTGFFFDLVGFFSTCFEESPAGAKQVLPGIDLFWHGLERAVGLVRSAEGFRSTWFGSMRNLRCGGVGGVWAPE